MEVKTGRRAIYIPSGEISGLYRLLSLRGEERNFSRLIDTAVDRYLITIAHSLPPFRDAEWCLVFDALQGVHVSDEGGLMPIGEDIIEAMEDEQLDAKWGVDGETLKGRLVGLTYAEKQAIGEMVEAFRIVHRQGGHDSYTTIIAEIKSHFRGDTSTEWRAERRSVRRSVRMSPDAL